MFDVISFLEEHDIEFHTSGKNVTRGWVEVNCPYCGDPSFHLGINLNTGLHHCWRCGEKGSPEKLIKRFLNISFKQAKQIVEEFGTTTSPTSQPVINANEIIFPKGMYTGKSLPYAHKEYLVKRRFDPDHIIDKHQIGGCLHIGGEFAHRIIIPIIMDGQVTSYTGRDISGLQKTKYKHLTNEKSIVSVKDSIYNIDSVTNKCIIVEGVFDAWRIGDGCIALFGVEYTSRQLNTLFAKNLEEAFVLFDSDAITKANKLGNVLSTFIPKVTILELSEGDPSDMNEKETKEIRELLEK